LAVCDNGFQVNDHGFQYVIMDYGKCKNFFSKNYSCAMEQFGFKIFWISHCLLFITWIKRLITTRM